MRVAMDPDLDLALRCAWLSHIGGYTHEEIATRVSASRIKVTRLILAAQRAGLVKITVEGAPAQCAALEDALIARFGLARCSVAPDLGEDGLPLSALGAIGAHVLRGVIERADVTTIGVGQGRTLSACVDALPLLSSPQLRIVALHGSLSRTSTTLPNDVIFRLAGRTGGTGHCVPAPFVCESEAERDALATHCDLAATWDLARSAPIMVVGIGSIDRSCGLMSNGLIDGWALDALRSAGTVAEVLGTFLDVRGRTIASAVDTRVIALPIDDLRNREVIAIAGGDEKVTAIAAALASGLVTHLVTDERTAQALAYMDGHLL